MFNLCLTATINRCSFQNITLYEWKTKTNILLILWCKNQSWLCFSFTKTLLCPYKWSILLMHITVYKKRNWKAKLCFDFEFFFFIYKTKSYHSFSFQFLFFLQLSYGYQTHLYVKLKSFSRSLFVQLRPLFVQSNPLCIQPTRRNHFVYASNYKFNTLSR